MQLSYQGIQAVSEWEKENISVPSYDVVGVSERTKKEPIWMHIGAGNIFRGYIATLQDKLLHSGDAERGIIAVEPFDYEIIDKIYKPYDQLVCNVALDEMGEIKISITGSIAEAIKGDFSKIKERNRLKQVIGSRSLQMISFTVTEKGYVVKGGDGEYLGVVKEDIERGPNEVRHTMSIVTALLYERYQNGRYPLAVVSMDNCSHNGDKVKESILAIAAEWEKRGKVEQDFVLYLKDERCVTYPWTMIDKITPRPSTNVEKELLKRGMEHMEVVVTDKSTYIAPFVNAEETEYLVIEDNFPNGRPELEKAGVYFTNRETVDMVERMKVTTCLNPLHTALAVYGCLLGYSTIAEAMNDEILVALVRRIGYYEGLKVVQDPKIIRPKEFIDEVVEKRLPNPAIPDSPQRIATDTSQKVGIRFGETLKRYAADTELTMDDLIGIPLVIAGWLRYLLGVEDQGGRMEVSPDPMLVELQNTLQGVVWNCPDSYQGQLKEILGNEHIFGVNLYEVGIANTIETLFVQQLSGVNAVRNTLERHLL